MKVIMTQPRGFCAGVVRAIEIVERALARYGPPIYVRHEIVHNKYVVDTLKAKGVRFVEELEDVPADAHAIFSAHGVSKRIEQEALARDLRVIDATCPLVTKVHNHGRRYAAQGRTIILSGTPAIPKWKAQWGKSRDPYYWCSRKRTLRRSTLRQITRSRMSLRRRSASTTPRGSSRRCIDASPISSARKRGISATLPRIARLPSANSARWP